MFATFKLLAAWIVLGVPAGLIGIPLTLITGRIGWMYRAGQRIGYLGLRAAGVTFQVSGRENIPAGQPCIFLSNHVSNLDPPTVLAFLPGTPAVMLKQSLRKLPLLGRAMELGRFVFVDREGGREAAAKAVRDAADAIASGLSLLIFAEGTRSRTGRLQAFKAGAFHIAEQTAVPIVPVVLSGTERMLRRGSVALTPGLVRVQFLPPIDPRQYRRRLDLLRATREAMVEALPEHMRPLADAGAELNQ